MPDPNDLVPPYPTDAVDDDGAGDESPRSMELQELQEKLQNAGKVRRPGVHLEDVQDLFTYHAPREDQKEHFLAVRCAARVFAEAVLEHAPNSPDRTVAIRKIREAVMTANAAIVFDGRY